MPFQSLPFISSLTEYKENLTPKSNTPAVRSKNKTAIEVIFPLLDDLQRKVTSYISPLEMAGEPSKEEKLRMARNASESFFDILAKNRIYIPATLYKHLDDHAMRLVMVTNSFTEGRMAEERNRFTGRDFWIESANELKPLHEEYEQLVEELRNNL